MFESLFKNEAASRGSKRGKNKKNKNTNDEDVISAKLKPSDDTTTMIKTKKKRQRPPKKHTIHNSAPADNNKQKKKPPSEEAIALSTELKTLSTQKRLNDALTLYYDPSNDSARDEYHACIIIDCCSRCGNIQEAYKVVQSLQKQQRGNVNVQTKTALLKGYVHSGMIRHASLLYQDMKQMKNKSQRPNVRTLNTLLRGCLWSAVMSSYHSKKKTYELFGGVVTSEKIWPRSSTNTIQPDLSSFEYSIILLCQALRIEDAKARIELLQSTFGIKIISQKKGSTRGGKAGSGGYQFKTNDPTSLETLSVAYMSLARSCALLNKPSDAVRYATMVSSLTKQMLEHEDGDNDNDCTKSSFQNSKKNMGGKRSWKSSNVTSNGSEEESNQEQKESTSSRRDVSNKLFRIHRVNEMQSEAKMILELNRELNTEKANLDDSARMKNLPFYLATRLLYFSGGGTTDVLALKVNDEDTTNNESEGNINIDSGNDSILHFHSLWYSFGLEEAMKEKYPNLKLNSRQGQLLETNDLNKITQTLCLDMKDKITDNGTINFTQVFCKHLQSSNVTYDNDRPLCLELGSGFGEWAVYQAQHNPSCDYVAVELRADRVSQIFAKAMLSNQSGPLTNLCSIGSECGHLLRHRIPQSSVSKIFINHPEPPTQTFGSNMSALRSIAAGGEEPAHMLNSETLLSAVKCLKTAGELIIVTDNRWYAKLICSTLLKVITCNQIQPGLCNKAFNKNAGIQQVDSFFQNVRGSRRQNRVNLYEGKPNESIGHVAPNGENSQGGTSYFDRLWKSGAGTHAETQRRFIIAMYKSQGSNIPDNHHSSKSQNATNKPKKSKKRSSEKQQRRNAKRLLKKQNQEQLQRSE